jgi:phosphohistidine phosphatase
MAARKAGGAMNAEPMTTRQLFLLRHGKAAWPDGVADHRRPLAPRGRVAVPLVAARLSLLAPSIDLVLVSDALRTQETFALVKGVIPALGQKIEPAIYDARPGVLLGLAQDLPDTATTVLMIGHNPGFHALALYLAGAAGSGSEAIQRMERKFPTSGLAHLAFDGRWRDLGAESATLRAFVTPAALGGVDED